MAPYLTLYNGQLLLNDAGTAFKLSDNLAVPCCCNCCDVPGTSCSVSSFGTSGGYGWFLGNGTPLTKDNLPQQLPFTIQFKYPNSTNCVPAGTGASSGTVTGCFVLSEPKTVRLTVSGLVEQQNSGFDQGSGSVSGISASIGSFNRGLGCAMIQASDSNSAVLLEGQHSYSLSARTNDSLFHVNMIHTFRVEFA